MRYVQHAQNISRIDWAAAHAGPDLAFRIPDVEGCPPAQPMSELLAFMQHEAQEAAKASPGIPIGHTDNLLTSR